MSEATTKAQPAAPVVSDEQIRKTVESIQDPDTVPAFSNGCYTLTPDELRRAILALRPVQVPMTDEEIESLLVNWPKDGIAFFEFARAIEAHHGITAQAEKETP